MALTITIVCITFLALFASILFFSHIKINGVKFDTYWIVAVLGAIALLGFGLVPLKEVWTQLTSNASINPIKIIILFFSMTIISIVLDELGLFRFLASVASKHAKGNQFILFIVLYFLVSILTVFTSNDVVILTLTPFICFFAKRSKINPIPYLIAEFMAANTWSLMFMIGNPTNIYLATSSNITFVEYFKVMAVPTLVAGIAELLLLILIFHKQLKKSLESSDVIYHIKDRVPVIVGLFILGICLSFLILSSYINMEMWLIALASALTLMIFMLIYSLFNRSISRVINISIKRLPYQLVPFFIAMFVIVVALNYQGISGLLASFLGNYHTMWIYGYSSFVASNLINNIPMSILFANLTSNLSGTSYYQAVYASIIGSNIGAFLTPIGALAGIMFSGLVKDNGVRLSFITFIEYGIIVSIPVITVCLAMTLLFI